MGIPDYYNILGVSRYSTNIEIKKAFRKLALQFHPDKNKNETAHEKFIEINEAYLILNDSDARKRYDNEYEYYFATINKNDIDKEQNFFYDETLNNWQKSAYKQASDYSKMNYSDYSDILSRALKETGFQFGNILIFMIFGISFISGFGLVLRQNYLTGTILILFGIAGQIYARNRWKNH